jgi:signal transduction histidine kinase
VQDAGPGIPSTDIPLLFGQFARLQRDLSGKVRGTGLGLYISKQLVEALDGRIWVESAGIPGQGSCFYFTLRQAHCVDTPASGESKPTTLLDSQSVGSLSE